MATQSNKILTNCLQTMLRPIVRFCIRRSIKLQEFNESLKQVYLNVAREELSKAGKKASGGALSVVTGVHRKDVARLKDDTSLDKPSNDIAVRVISTWQTARQFTTARGYPKTLSHGSLDSEFTKLVESVSVDVRAAAVLSQLELIGSVKLTSRGVRLVNPSFSPRKDTEAIYGLLGSDMRDLIQAVQENAEHTGDIPHYHIKTEYDNVVQEALPDLRYYVLKEATDFHRRLMKHISQFDKDVNPTLAGRPGGGRVAVIGFSRVENEGENDEVATEVA